MDKKMNLFATFALAAMLAVMSVSAVAPSWSVDKSVVVTGDYKWDGASWTLPSPAPTTATYQFQAAGKGYLGYQESENLGSAWKYDYHNALVSSDSGSIYAAGFVTTVNDPAVTPASGGYSDYAFGVQNVGHYTSSQVVISGSGFADFSHSANFVGDFTSKNFFCVNDCATE